MGCVGFDMQAGNCKTAVIMTKKQKWLILWSVLLISQADMRRQQAMKSPAFT